MKKDRSGHCIKCGIFRRILHRDHIVPKWSGGSDEEFNVQYLCANCHQDKTLSETDSEEFKNWRREDNKKRYADPLNRKKASEAWTLERRANQSIVQKKRFENPTERMKTSAAGKGFKWKEERKISHKKVMREALSSPEVRAVLKAGQQRRREAEAARKALLTPEQRKQESIQLSIKRAEMKLARLLAETNSSEVIN